MKYNLESIPVTAPHQQSNGVSSEKYRADIDGLRAVAICLVLLFHATRYVPGGFVGVDVFFVISGYLITLHIVKEIDAGKFSIATFYEKRIRRIFPAFLVMLFVTFLAAWKLLLPDEFIDYSKSLLSASLSVSNFYFWKHSDYFAEAQLPLQHTWSLAIEEQFYLLFPAFLLLLRKYMPQYFRKAITAVSLASFLLSVATVTRFPEATFYLIPSRAWELLMGGMLAVGIFPKPSRGFLCEILSALGLIFILVAGFVYSPATPFPGPTALLPCLGSVLIISANDGKRTLVRRLLSTRPFVGLGLISYSLYLWHWPIIIFKRFDVSLTFGKVASRLVPSLAPSQAATIDGIGFTLIVSITSAVLSWKFVEQPFRFGPMRPQRRNLFLGAAAASASLIAIAVPILCFHGFPDRFAPRVVEIASGVDTHKDYRRGTCFIASNDRASTISDSCMEVDPAKHNVLLIGDSHAAQLYHGLSTEFPSIHFLQVSATGCKGVISSRFGETPKCRRIMETAFYHQLPGMHIDSVILASRWESFDLNRIGNTVAYLQKLGVRVFVVGPTPRYDAPLPRLLAVGIEIGKEGLAAGHRLRTYDDLDETMARLARGEWHVTYISYVSLLCSKGNCLEYAGPNIPLQTDGEHLSDAGSLVFANRLQKSGILLTGGSQR